MELNKSLQDIANKFQPKQAKPKAKPVEKKVVSPLAPSLQAVTKSIPNAGKPTARTEMVGKPVNTPIRLKDGRYGMNVKVAGKILPIFSEEQLTSADVKDAQEFLLEKEFPQLYKQYQASYNNPDKSKGVLTRLQIMSGTKPGDPSDIGEPVNFVEAVQRGATSIDKAIKPAIDKAIEIGKQVPMPIPGTQTLARQLDLAKNLPTDNIGRSILDPFSITSGPAGAVVKQVTDTAKGLYDPNATPVERGLAILSVLGAAAGPSSAAIKGIRGLGLGTKAATAGNIPMNQVMSQIDMLSNPENADILDAINAVKGTAPSVVQEKTNPLLNLLDNVNYQFNKGIDLVTAPFDDLKAIGGKSLLNRASNVGNQFDPQELTAFKNILDQYELGIVDRTIPQIIEDAKTIRLLRNKVDLSPDQNQLLNSLFDQNGYPITEELNRLGKTLNIAPVEPGLNPLGRFNPNKPSVEFNLKGRPFIKKNPTLGTERFFDPYNAQDAIRDLRANVGKSPEATENYILGRVAGQEASKEKGQLYTSGKALSSALNSMNLFSIKGRLQDFLSNVANQGSYVIDPIERGTRSGILRLIGLNEPDITRPVWSGFFSPRKNTNIFLPDRYGNTGLTGMLMGAADAPTKSGWVELFKNRAALDDVVQPSDINPMSLTPFSDIAKNRAESIKGFNYSSNSLTPDVMDEAIRYGERKNFSGPSFAEPIIRRGQEAFERIPFVGQPLGNAILRYGNTIANVATDAVERTPIGFAKALTDLGMANKARGGVSGNPLTLLSTPVRSQKISPEVLRIRSKPIDSRTPEEVQFLIDEANRLEDYKLLPEDLRKFADTLGKATAGTTWIGAGLGLANAIGGGIGGTPVQDTMFPSIQQPEGGRAYTNLGYLARLGGGLRPLGAGMLYNQIDKSMLSDTQKQDLKLRVATSAFDQPLFNSMDRIGKLFGQEQATGSGIKQAVYGIGRSTLTPGFIRDLGAAEYPEGSTGSLLDPIPDKIAASLGFIDRMSYDTPNAKLYGYDQNGLFGLKNIGPIPLPSSNELLRNYPSYLGGPKRFLMRETIRPENTVKVEDLPARIRQRLGIGF